MTLKALYKNGRCPTSTLREKTGCEKSRKIRYRIDEHLRPVGLVEEVDREEHPGNDERVHRLTDAGRQWVDEHWDELDDYVERKEIADTHRQVSSRLDDVMTTFDQLSSRQDAADTAAEQANQRTITLETDLNAEIEDLHEEVDELTTKIERLEAGQDGLEEDVGDVRDDIDELDDRLSHVKEVAEEAWAWTVGSWVDDRRDPETGQWPWQKVENEVEDIIGGLTPDRLREWRDYAHDRDWRR